MTLLSMSKSQWIWCNWPRSPCQEESQPAISLPGHKLMVATKPCVISLTCVPQPIMLTRVDRLCSIDLRSGLTIIGGGKEFEECVAILSQTFFVFVQVAERQLPGA